MLIGVSLVFAGLILTPTKLNAEEVIPSSPKVYTKSELIDKVYQYAKIWKNDPQKIINTINCEDKDWDPNLQSELTYKSGNRWGFAGGTQEKSYGLVQIHLPDHKDITKEQATDPDFALNYIAEHLGRDDSWSCYKKNP